MQKSRTETATELFTQNNKNNTPRRPADKYKKRIFYIVLFAMLGTLMFCSKIVMEFLPNIHLIGMLTMAYTIVFREKALIPIYVFVLLTGLYGGFGLWWFPYLYIWTILWGVTMLLPPKMPKWLKIVLYPTVCAIHGFLYGILYAPAEALMFKLDFDGMIAWIISGIPFDLIHGLGNLVAGMLILPVSSLLFRLVKKSPIGQ